VSGNEKVNRIIGVIGKPHGIKGYSYVRLVTDYPDTIFKEDILYLDELCTKKLKIEDIKNVICKGQSRLIFKFYGNEDSISAESLRDCNLYRDSASQPRLDKDSHWVDELLGCSVYLQGRTSSGNKTNSISVAGNKSERSNNCGYIGIIEEVKSCAYNDNLIIAAPDGKTIIMPMYEEYIERIDVKAKKIFLKCLPEYI
jgi:ribosomal 30S subunit maturation factor RimM